MKHLVFILTALLIGLSGQSQTYFLLDDYTVINPSAPGNCDGSVVINSLPAGTANHVVYYQNSSGGIFYSSSDTITGLCEDWYFFSIADQDNRIFNFFANIETVSGLPNGLALDTIILEPESSVGACDGYFQISSNYGVNGELFSIYDGQANYFYNSTLTGDPAAANGLCIPYDILNFDLSGYQFVIAYYLTPDCYTCILDSDTANINHSANATSCDGSIDIIPIGGVYPYIVEVSNGDSVNVANLAAYATISNLCPGSYTYTITDYGGNTTNGNFTINDLGMVIDTAKLMTVYYRVINPVNPGDCNGALVVDSIINGTPPYYFHLNKANDSLWFVLPGAAAYNLCDWGYIFEVYDSNCDHVFITAQPNDATSQYYTRSFQVGLTNETTVGTCDGELELNFFPNLYSGNMTISNYNTSQVYFTGGQVTNPATYSNICMSQSEGIQIDLSPNFFDSYSAVNDFAFDGFGQFCQPFVVEKNITPVTALGNCDGEIDLTIYGGHPPYIFEYSNGSTFEDLTGLCAGYYRVEFHDTYSNYKGTSFIITDSAHLYENDLTFIPSDTLYSNTFENCDFNYSLPIDTVYLDTAYITGPNLITTEYIVVQDTNEFIFIESFQYDSLMNYVVYFDIYCTNRSVDGYYSIHTGLPLINIFNGIDELSSNNEIQNLNVYPNPSNSLLNIDFFTTENLAIEIDIYDISGRLMHSKEYAGVEGSNMVVIDVSNFSNGVYFLQVKSENHILGTRKIIRN